MFPNVLCYFVQLFKRKFFLQGAQSESNNMQTMWQYIEAVHISRIVDMRSSSKYVSDNLQRLRCG